MNWRCLVFGHKPHRVRGTAFIVCKRDCDKVRRIVGAPGSAASRGVWL